MKAAPKRIVWVRHGEVNSGLKSGAVYGGADVPLSTNGEAEPNPNPNLNPLVPTPNSNPNSLIPPPSPDPDPCSNQALTLTLG